MHTIAKLSVYTINSFFSMITSVPQFDVVQSTPIRTAEFKAVDDDKVVPKADLMLEDAKESFLQEAVEEGTTKGVTNSAEDNFARHSISNLSHMVVK